MRTFVATSLATTRQPCHTSSQSGRAHLADSMARRTPICLARLVRKGVAILPCVAPADERHPHPDGSTPRLLGTPRDAARPRPCGQPSNSKL
ncbi:hypothetical protein PsYK624_090330 [Phanerochaete sordida]|uniref:Uncharacterized protein n=1 Tax=Phanerochaete sordida TaxID=48140 RepID=A0A9P3LF24_9APHY|nr:hypothetical protein PsYK624_090330 [Phanerochaete sordida]